MRAATRVENAKPTNFNPFAHRLGPHLGSQRPRHAMELLQRMRITLLLAVEAPVFYRWLLSRVWRGQGLKGFRLLAMVLSSLAFLLNASVASATNWQPIRSGPNTSGWSPVTCDSSVSGWRSCEMPLTIVITASPTSIAAVGEQSLLTATVTDYSGNNAGAAILIVWTTTDGTLSAQSSVTDVNGITQVVLTSSHQIGGATVTATASSEGGSGTINVPFTDKWVPIAPIYTAWANTGSPYNCSAWTPDPSTVAAGSAYTQTATCYQNQIAYQQNREQSSVTGQIYNVGAPIALAQTVLVTSTQTALGTLSPPPPPAQPEPPAATTCYYHYELHDGFSRVHGWALYDGGVNNNQAHLYVQGELPNRDYIKGTSGYIDYNGYRYTVGDKQQKETLGGNSGVIRWWYSYCKTPL